MPTAYTQAQAANPNSSANGLVAQTMQDRQIFLCQQLQSLTADPYGIWQALTTLLQVGGF